MKTYEVVKDPKSGRTRVFVREEHHPCDPFSSQHLRSLQVERRARLASLKALWIELRYAWRDRTERSQISGLLFMVAFVSVPIACGIVAVFDTLFSRSDPAAMLPYIAESFALLSVGVLVLSFWRGASSR